MSGILRLESLTKGNTLKQGDKTPLKYRLFDADGEKLNIAGKSAKVRLVYPDFLTIGYEKDGLTVAQDDTVTFAIDGVIPSRIYHVEIIVDNKFVFPSRADEAKFTVDKSSLGTEANVIEVVGVDQIVNTVLGRVDADISQAVTDITTTNEAIKQAEQERAQGYQEIKQLIEDEKLDAIPANGSVTTEKLASESVAPIKTTFVNVGKNLFNKDDVIVGFTIHPTGGNLAANAAYCTSDYIKVTAGEIITQNQGWVVAFYGDDDILVPGSISPTSNPDTPRTITVPTGATKMRSSVSNVRKDTYQIEKGEVVTSYEPYELVYDYLRNTIRDREQDVKLEFQDVLNEYNLKYFTLYDENSASGQPLETKLKIYSAFAFIKITGSDADKPHHIRYIARNHPDVGYRMIIERKDDAGWVQIIDTGALRLTENEHGPTILTYSNSQYSLEAHIDYRLFPADSWSGSLGNARLDGQFILTKNAFGIVEESGSGGGEAYDQRLNTTDNVSFNTVSSNAVNADTMAIGGEMPTGTLTSPPTGLLSGDVWADTTDSSTHPVLRVKL